MKLQTLQVYLNILIPDLVGFKNLRGLNNNKKRVPILHRDPFSVSIKYYYSAIL